MKKEIIFEGFGDVEPNWEFDMPIYMIKPIRRMKDDAGNILFAENLIEDYLIDLSLGGKLNDDTFCNWKKIVQLFYKAKSGTAGKNIVYWKCKVIINGDITSDEAFTKGIIKQEKIKYYIQGKKIER